MAAQIEAPETIKVIRELAQRTGQSDERAVDTAVREQLARLRTPEEEAERRTEVYALVRDLQASFKAHPEAVVDIDELLYDELGLPRTDWRAFREG
jgi:antitoxin VapB